jgi:hypothetical protein
MAVEQITNALPPPSYCDVCCSVNINLVTNDKIYGRIYGEWPYAYYCDDCKAAVGCHPNTYIPLGRMADKETRQLRTKAHAAFDPLWRSGLMTRSKAYFWLACELKLDVAACHISWLSKQQLKQTVEIAAKYFAETAHLVERRKEKRNAKIAKQREFERKQISARKSKR